MSSRVSSEAEEDLLSIWDYTAKRWNETQADLYIAAFIVRFTWLTRNRGLWKERPDIGEGLYSYPEKSHVIFFREYRRGIEILRVLHGRMDLKRHF